MQRSEFYYELPPQLIAQHPLAERSASRLLCLDGSSGSRQHRSFGELPELLGADDLLVFNDTRVIPARLWGLKETGGKVEILVERTLGSHQALAHVRASKSPRAGTVIHLTDREGASPRLSILPSPAGRASCSACRRRAGRHWARYCRRPATCPCHPISSAPTK